MEQDQNQTAKEESQDSSYLFDQPIPVAGPSPRIEIIDYTNYRGERSLRRVVVLGVSHKSTDYHTDPQWIVTAIDMDKNAVREFAARDIHHWPTDVYEKPIAGFMLPGALPRTDPELLALLKKAAERKLEPGELFEQRVSWCYAEVGDKMTKDQVRAHLRSLGYGPQGDSV